MSLEPENKDEQTFVQSKRLNLFSNLANIFAWLNLLGVIVYPIYSSFQLDREFIHIGPNGLVTGQHWWDIIESDYISIIVFPIILATISMIGNFLLFKSVSIGLNILMEIGFTMFSDKEESKNE